MKIEQRKIDKLIPYINNSRKHSEKQVTQIAASIKEFGWTNPILVDGENGVIAGHGRLMAAKKLDMEKVPVIELAHLTDAQRKALIIADNKLALNADWDEKTLKLELESLKESNYDLSILGFDLSEIEDITGLDVEDLENPYTDKVDSPNYEPNEAKPEVQDLYDDTKAMGLIEDIKNSKLSDKEKTFLMAAASRHIVFNFQQIADYYAHSSPECQELMEQSALVIVDFNKAIELGFIKLSEKLSEQYNEDKNAE
jgi:ParB-like chromosome segregation protein Spo0J